MYHKLKHSNIGKINPVLCYGGPRSFIANGNCSVYLRFRYEQ